MKFDIPEQCHIRWQAALAVLEDLQEDKEAPFNQRWYASFDTVWEKINGCGTAACFAGYISVAPYCKELGLPSGDGDQAVNWLCPSETGGGALWQQIFSYLIDQGSRSNTLA